MHRILISLSVFLIATLSFSVASAQVPNQPPASDGIRPGPRWFKGNLHAHTLWSDGNDFPEMVVDWYVRHRYQFIALSEHDVLAQGERWIPALDAKRRAQRDTITRYRHRFGADWVESRTERGELQIRLKPFDEYRTLFERSGRFLLMEGEEITDKLDSKPIHLNATNLVEELKPLGGKNATEVMGNNFKAIEDQSKELSRPILAHLNHPNLSYAITAEELAAVKKVRFFEIYNGHPSVNQSGDDTHVGMDRMWDIVNTIRIAEMKAPPIFGLANDDAHSFLGEGFFLPGRGWVMVRCRFLTPESIIRAMEAGDFYGSTGVILKDVAYSAEMKTLTVEIAPLGDAKYTIRFIGTMKGYDPTRKPVLDKDGKPLPLPVTQKYSDDVGKVLSTAEGLKAIYRLTGEELYVRAVVISDQRPENPSYTGQKAQAWTQPVGWEKWIPISEPDRAVSTAGGR